MVGDAGDQPLTDGRRTVLDGDADAPLGPVAPDLTQNRREELFAQDEHLDVSSRQALDHLAGGELVTVHQQPVQPVPLNGPAAHGRDAQWRDRPGPLGREALDLVLGDVVGGADLAGAQRPVAHPTVGGLVVNPQPVGRGAEVHGRQNLASFIRD